MSWKAYNFITLDRATKFFAVSLFDPFLIDCIVFDKDTTHDSMASRDAFGGFMFATFRA